MTTTAYRTITTAYRDPLERARETLAELTDSLRQSLPAARERERVVMRRAARVVFGGVGIGGALSTVAAAIANSLSSELARFVITDVLIMTWVAAGGAYLLARLLGVVGLRTKNPTWTGSLFEDIRRFAAVQAGRRDGRFLGVLSLVLPAVAISLLTPLTLHLGFEALTNQGSADVLFRRFDEWIVMSMIVVGHAHVALAALAGRFGFQVARMPLEQLAVDETRGFKALLWTILVSAVPGIVLFAIPPLLVAVTGVAFVPFLFIATRRIALAERTALSEAGIEIV
jgi:hypothetical protein